MKKILTAIITVLVTSQSAFAGIITIKKPEGLPGPTASQQAGAIRTWFAESLLPGWATGLIAFVGTAAFAMLIVSGIRYLTAYTNEEAATGAKKQMIYSMVGLLIAIFSYAIVAIIANLKI